MSQVDGDLFRCDGRKTKTTPSPIDLYWTGRLNWSLKKKKLFDMPNSHYYGTCHRQAGTVLGQAQLKLELELYFTSFKIRCMKLIN